MGYIRSIEREDKRIYYEEIQIVVTFSYFSSLDYPKGNPIRRDQSTPKHKN